MRYRRVLLTLAGMSIEVRDLRSSIGDDRGVLAMYYPWVATVDPTQQAPEVLTPPSGFIAGIYAHTDVNAVWQSPANEVFPASRFELPINQFHKNY